MVGSLSKRFGPRYGKTVKKRYDAVEAMQKKTYECPFCGYKKVKRVSAGIWKCEKCNKQFSSGAYEMRIKSKH
ncbi:MAG: large subunit ribosomal protein L37Ae [Candidatus Woesearchaeota archaeon]|nr:large subunit ribosomal protein L37Ae [Candidatus Woesearchaeota archaeon]